MAPKRRKNDAPRTPRTPTHRRQPPPSSNDRHAAKHRARTIRRGPPRQNRGPKNGAQTTQKRRAARATDAQALQAPSPVLNDRRSHRAASQAPAAAPNRGRKNGAQTTQKRRAARAGDAQYATVVVPVASGCTKARGGGWRSAAAKAAPERRPIEIRTDRREAKGEYRWQAKSDRGVNGRVAARGEGGWGAKEAAAARGVTTTNRPIRSAGRRAWRWARRRWRVSGARARLACQSAPVCQVV